MSERIVVCGSRMKNTTIGDLAEVHDAIRSFFVTVPRDAEIITGGARGVDSWANAYANTLGMKWQIVEARWDLYGRAAGPIRNRKMLDIADRVVAFWDGESPGTRDTIEEARRRDIPVDVVLLRQRQSA